MGEIKKYMKKSILNKFKMFKKRETALFNGKIVKEGDKNVRLHNVEEKAIVVYGKSNGKLVYLRIFDYPDEEFEAKVQFDRLMNDLSISEYRMMTIDRFSEVIEEGCRVID